MNQIRLSAFLFLVLNLVGNTTRVKTADNNQSITGNIWDPHLLYWYRYQLNPNSRPWWYAVSYWVNMNKSTVTVSVVEPFHFGPAPAPAGQDGGYGFGFGSSSSSSTVVHNLLLKKKSFEKFHFSIYGVLFYSKKGTSALLWSSSTLFKETD